MRAAKMKTASIKRFMQYVTGVSLLLAVTPAMADMAMTMHKEAFTPIYSAGFNKLEWQKNPAEEELLNWEFSSWLSTGIDKWWLKSEGKASDKNTHDGFVQLLYSQPVSAFWDLQLGLHSQIEPWQEDYLLVGLFGLAPYFVNIDSYVLLNSNGDIALRINADYDLKLSQNWQLLVDGKVTVQGQNKLDAGIGSGVSESEFGMRVAYQKQRKFVPYVGLEWSRAFGHSADAREILQESVSEWRGVLGVNLWY